MRAKKGGFERNLPEWRAYAAVPETTHESRRWSIAFAHRSGTDKRESALQMRVYFSWRTGNWEPCRQRTPDVRGTGTLSIKSFSDRWLRFCPAQRPFLRFGRYRRLLAAAPSRCLILAAAV